MKTKPMLFQGDMVRAVLDGSKTQTRRIVKHSRQWPIEFIGPEGSQNDAECWGFEDPNTGIIWTLASDGASQKIPCPYGKPGDLIWVRETFAHVPSTAYLFSEGVEQRFNPEDPERAAIYRASFDRSGNPGWSPSIHMPRWASRLTLEVTDTRVERVQEIADRGDGLCRIDDVEAEGLTHIFDDQDDRVDSARAVDWFKELWDSINAPRGYGWDANPWVWVVEFRAIHDNVDNVLRYREAT